MKNILSVENIEKYYGNKDNITKAIDNINFKVDKGEFVGIMGPSGSGKTTLLNCISTIDTVTTGNIIINNKDITKLKSKQLEDFRKDELGFIFQDFNLLDTLTAYENIALALTIQGVKPSEVDSKIKNVAENLGIIEVLNKYPYQMSGGQKQRVASARAIVTNPSLILADEPTGALDYQTGKNILKLLQETCRKENMTVVLVTHNQAITPMADRVIRVKNSKVESMVINKKLTSIDDIEW